MKRIPRSQALCYELDFRLEPVLHVKEGESFEVETEDAASGRLTSEATPPTLEHRPELKAWPARVNPVAGPIHVEGARPGDVLAVKVEDIEVPEQGLTWIRPGLGPLGDSKRWMGDVDAFTRVLRHEPGPSGTRRDGRVRMGSLSWPVMPFLGTLATAAERHVPTSGWGQGPFGGNLDVRDFAPGNTVLLNVYQPGALLFVGDVHASQADTEYTGTADEIRSVVRLSCTVIPEKRLPAPRVLKKDSIVFLGIDRPLEAAVERAMKALLEWLTGERGVDKRDACLLTSVHSELRVHVYQMVPGSGLDYVAGVEFPAAGP